MSSSPEFPSDPGLVALVRDLLTHLERWCLLRWRLPQVQAHQVLIRVQRGLVLMIFAILIGLLGALALVASIMMALATVVPAWAAAGIVGVGLSVLAVVLFA